MISHYKGPWSPDDNQCKKCSNLSRNASSNKRFGHKMIDSSFLATGRCHRTSKQNVDVCFPNKMLGKWQNYIIIHQPKYLGPFLELVSLTQPKHLFPARNCSRIPSFAQKNGSFSMMGQVGKFANFVIRLWKFALPAWFEDFFPVLLDPWEKNSLNMYLQAKDKMTQMAGWSALSSGGALFFTFSCASWLVILQFTWVYPPA